MNMAVKMLRYALKESKTLRLRIFAHKRGKFFNDDLLKKTEFTGWDGFFEYLSGRPDERLVIAIDEFPYLVKEDPGPCAYIYQISAKIFRKLYI
ncbi:MAG: hypothetical protein C5S40_02190 [ANME-2 cluster archaeon]|nr:hypothetical protein [ANME-2 cluster archaeon]